MLDQYIAPVSDYKPLIVHDAELAIGYDALAIDSE
jgi:hypothetical protein